MKKHAKRFFAGLLVLVLLILIPPAASAAGTGSSAGVVTTSSGGLYVRSGASTSYSILTKLSRGSTVTLLSESGGWWRVEYGPGQYGYCSAAYISQVQGSYAAYTSGCLNIRSGPGTNYGVIGWLNNYEYAVVLSSEGNWRKVLFDGVRIGYVSGSYLQTGTDSGYTAVSLSVPSYKQTDTRWAYTTLGSSGKTIGDDGCSTVALAMAESYRTGTTIDPNTMAARLSYTSGGAVYWPSNYSAYTGSDYLSVIYNRLKAGKTVLVGLKSAYGGQHWSVVTGFTGGSSLTASGFTVNDPGSSSRTTLQQVISAYPYFIN
jgi:uncharacterized protein YraI